MFSKSSLIRTTPALVICFLCLATPCISQQDTLIKGYPNEIGLDFAPFLRGQQGLSLLYKHEAGHLKTGEWQKRNAVRVLAGFYKEELSSDDLPYVKGDTTFTRYSTGDANNYFINLGIERQLTKRKFRFYFGADIGFHGSFYKSDTRVDAIVNGSTFPYDSYQGEVTARTLEASAFGGCNFFFLPRFSIGLELYYSLGIELSTSKIIRNGEVSSSNEQTTFVGVTDWPRLLYLSYHF